MSSDYGLFTPEIRRKSICILASLCMHRYYNYVYTN